jgi:glycosyltransferase involved in cell wall biosynthesis
MKEPKITVLIDTFNYGHFIDEAIESVLSQTFPMEQAEILVVDDGSTDDTPDRMKKYGSRIRYLRKSNGGQASAFNFGLARAHGEIVALLDADDRWMPDKLFCVMREFEKHPEAGLVYHRLREYDMQTGKSRDAPFEAISGFVPSNLKHMILFQGFTTSSLAFRRSAIESLLPIPEMLKIQADAYLGNLVIFVTSVAAIDRPLAIYRIHGSNLYYHPESAEESERLRRRIDTRRVLVDGMTTWFRSHGYDTRRPEVRSALLRWVILSERDEYKLSPPSRIRFFWHLMKSYSYNGVLMSWRIRAVNYFNAMGALIVGYKHFPTLEENRERVTRFLWGRARASYRSRQPADPLTIPATRANEGSLNENK